MFDFKACEKLGVNLKQVYTSGRTDGLFDTIHVQYKANEKFLKEHGTQKDHVNLISIFAQYFVITKYAKDLLRALI